MRMMSFALTKRQFKAREKDVTRRLGWKYLKPGDHFMAVEKAMGLKKGEKVVKLGECVCISNTPERLDSITQEEVNREGFPEMTPAQFIGFFCNANGCRYDAVINRIVFRIL